MTRGRLVPLLLLWFQFLSLGIFLYGFFPVKTPVIGKAGWEDVPDASEARALKVSPRDLWKRRRIGQLCIVLIDALRTDFVLSHDKIFAEASVYYGPIEERPKIRYLAEAIADGRAEAVVAKGTPPTVTLPRIKALTTGSLPGFVDVVQNFGSSELGEDSIVGQWRASNRIVNMFGDDTWIKLFPDAFLRQDGTTSFFVADYTEVDDNVTRHLEEELSRSDWDVTILHYLGLDHIGHLAGPASPLVPAKLDEMGDVIKTIVDSLTEKASKSPPDQPPPLVLVLGDHGMSDAGSHGGASVAEVMTPVVALGPAVRQKRARSRVALTNQQDLPSTLAFLTGVPIPRNNLGSLIPTFLDLGSTAVVAGEKTEDEVSAWLYNAEQVAKVLVSNLGRATADQNVGYRHLWEAKKRLADGSLEEAASLLKLSLKLMGDELAGNLLEYNLPAMALGIALMTVVAVLSYVMVSEGLSSIKPLSKVVCFLEFIRIASMGSTSFIEEEHQTVYFFMATILVYVTFQASKRPSVHASKEVLVCLLALAAFRIVKKLNQTGDKWSHLPDISDWLLIPENALWLTAVHALSLLLIWHFARSGRLLDDGLSALSFTLVYTHHAATKAGVAQVFNLLPNSRGLNEARVCYLIFAVQVIWLLARPCDLGRRCSALRQGLLPVLCLLAPPQSAPVFSFWLLAEAALARSGADSGLVVRGFAYAVLGSSGHFLLGNSNSIATIDVGAGYTGLTFYHPVLVSALILVNAYGLSMLAHLSLYSRGGGDADLESAAGLHSLARSLHSLFLLVVVSSQRYHLFVWTVFSPKLLYETAEALVTAATFTVIYAFSLRG